MRAQRQQLGGSNRGHGTMFYAGLPLYSWIGLMRHSRILVYSLSSSGLMKRIQHDHFTKDQLLLYQYPIMSRWSEAKPR